EAAQIILLLISPYFLASEYCHDIEMKRAIERHGAGEATIIPVILNPCDWKNSAIGKFRVSPTDGKPITKFPNVHDGYMEVVEDVRRALKTCGNVATLHQRPEPQHKVAEKVVPDRSSNLRVKRRFTDQERDEFLDSSFDYISNFFEASLQELSRRHEEI